MADWQGAGQRGHGSKLKVNEKAETANILAKVNKKLKLGGGDPRPVHPVANQPDDTDKVTSMFCTVC